LEERILTIGPLQYLLGSLAGCAAGLIKNTLAPLTGTSVDSVDVDAQCDFDVKGVLGMEGATGDIRNVSLTVTVYSDDSQDKIEKLLEIWKQRAPVFLCFQKPVQISTNPMIKSQKTSNFSLIREVKKITLPLGNSIKWATFPLLKYISPNPWDYTVKTRLTEG